MSVHYSYAVPSLAYRPGNSVRRGSLSYNFQRELGVANAPSVAEPIIIHHVNAAPSRIVPRTSVRVAVSILFYLVWFPNHVCRKWSGVLAAILVFAQVIWWKNA